MHAKLVTIEGQQAEGMEAAIIQFRERSLKAMRGVHGHANVYAGGQAKVIGGGQ